MTVYLQLPMTNKNIDFSTLLREVARSSVIHEVKGIKRAITHPKDKDLILRTDGINITVCIVPPSYR